MNRLLFISFIILVLSACYKTKEEELAQIRLKQERYNEYIAPCVSMCEFHNGFAYIGGGHSAYNGGGTRYCVCNDGTQTVR